MHVLVAIPVYVPGQKYIYINEKSSFLRPFSFP